MAAISSRTDLQVSGVTDTVLDGHTGKRLDIQFPANGNWDLAYQCALSDWRDSGAIAAQIARSDAAELVSRGRSMIRRSRRGALPDEATTQQYEASVRDLEMSLTMQRS